MKIHANPVSWYCCPSCGDANTMSIFTMEGTCKGCMNTWKAEQLFKHYGFEQPNENFVFMASEYTCKCGWENVAFTRTLDYNISKADDGSMKIDGKVAMPLFGLCEECGAGYDLSYSHCQTKSFID